MDYDALIREKRLLPPLDHAEPSRMVIAITGLTHLGSATSRDEMHAKLASGVTKEPFVYYLLAAAFFLAMTWLTYYVARRVETWAARGFHPVVTKGASHAL